MTPLTAEEQAMAEAVETLYEVLSVYPLAQKVEGCPCCVSDEDESSLHRKPLHELTAKDLSRYAFKALSTWGTEDDFKHFLPRLLELAADPYDVSYEIDVEVLFGKMRYAKWRNWPPAEQQAVSSYFSALWQWLLTLPVEEWVLDDYLCAIANAEGSLAVLSPRTAAKINSEGTMS